MATLRKPYRTAASLPIYPILFALWFVLFEYSHNRNDLTPSVVFKPLVAALVIASLLLGMSLLAVRSLSKAALIAGSLVFITFSYGHLADFIRAHGPDVLASGRFLLPFLLLFFGGLVYLILRTQPPERLLKITPKLNLVGLVLVLFNLAPVIFSTQVKLTPDKSPGIKISKNLKNPPDIYYIVPEDYAGNRVLKSHFKYDNSEFTNYLDSKGFITDANSIPNYPYSPPSLASTLNMRYLDREAKQYDGKTKSVVPYYNLMEDNRVVRTFKSIGYQYVHVGSWWGPTSKSKLADKTFSTPTSYTIFNKPYIPTEFERTLFNTSIGQILLKHPARIGGLTFFKSQSSSTDNRAQTLFSQVDYIKQSVVPMKGPKFTFMHIMSPHRPFVFDEDCKQIAEGTPDTIEFAKTQYIPRYVEQLKCTNRQLRQIIDTILSQSSRPPIIVLQSDEGEYPFEYWQGEIEKDRYDWYKAPADLLKIKFQSQSAFYLPGMKNPNMKDVAFVNTFRFILSQYFGADLPNLPQKYYISDEHASPYNFKDVTTQLQSKN